MLNEQVKFSPFSSPSLIIVRHLGRPSFIHSFLSLLELATIY